MPVPKHKQLVVELRVFIHVAVTGGEKEAWLACGKFSNRHWSCPSRKVTWRFPIKSLPQPTRDFSHMDEAVEPVRRLGPCAPCGLIVIFGDG